MYKEKKLVKMLIRCLPKRFESYKAVIKATMNSDNTKFDKLMGLLMSFELERTQDQPLPVKGSAFTANAEDERVKKLEADVSLMAISFNNIVKRLDKGVSRSFQMYQPWWNSEKRKDL